MTCHSARKVHAFSFVALFVVIVGILATLAALAQVRNAGQVSGDTAAVSASPGAITPAPALQQAANGAQRTSATRGRAKRTGSAAQDSLFLPPVTYDTGGYNPAAVAIADVNGDGKPDLVVANSCTSANSCPIGEGLVGVLLGNGDGTFQAPLDYDAGIIGTVGLVGGSVTVTDVNGDGKPDVVVVGGCSTFQHCSSQGVVGVLLGYGDGTFQPVATYASGGVTAVSVATADVNGDGKLDLLVANQCADSSCVNGSVAVLLGNGDGTFQAAVAYSSGGLDAGGIAVADVKGDGKQDLVVANYCATTAHWGPNACGNYPYADGTVGILLGNGDGTFQPIVLYDAGGGSTNSVALADVNGDGKLDLLTANCGTEDCGPARPGGVVGVLFGNGDGTFRAAVPYGAGNSPDSIAIADVNGDGKLDVVVANWGTSEESNAGAGSVLLGNGDGTFQAAQIYLSGGNEATSVAVADLNGDGEPDVVLGDYGSNGANPPPGIVSVLLNDTTFTTTTLISSLNPSAFGQAVTFSVTVSAASGTATGTVAFYDGSTAIGSATLTNGSASISVSSLAVGSQSITAAYQGSGNFGPSTSAPLNQVVSPASTTTSLVSSANPARIKRNVAYTATVTSQYGGVATGTVTFQDGGATIATVALSGNQAAYTTFYSKAGIHSITATYSGDPNNAGSMSPVLIEEIGKVRFPSQTTLATSGSPSLVGQPVTFTATVTSAYGTIPDGELVTFHADGKIIGTGTTAGGVATFTTSSLTAKSHTIKATYAGDTSFGTSSGEITQVVDKYVTTTTFVSSPNPSAYGQAVTFTATVTPTGPNTPTGKVKFGGMGSATLSGGVATLTKTWLNAGTYAITAKYEGDSSNAPSTSSVLDQMVNPASTTTAITSSANPSSSGQTVTFTATVTSSTGAHATGTVTFTAGAATLGTVALNGSVASISTDALPVGSTLITATYNGAADFTGSSASLTQTVQP